MILPNFLIIGAQKCGTTWMYEIFRDHPDIYLPDQREIEFFSYTNRPIRIGLEGYSEFFSHAAGQKAIGEKTASYLWNSEDYPVWCNKPPGFQKDIPGAVNRALGDDVKLLVSLRNPVSRAVSAYIHHIHWKNVQRGEPFLEAGKRNGIVHMGFYFAHLKRWFDVFEPDRIKVMIFEDMMRDTSAACTDLFTFLGVDPEFRSPKADQVVHKGIEKVRIEGDIYIPKPGVRLSTEDPAPLEQLDLVATQSDLEYLAKLYLDDITQLEDLLDRDLSIWRK